jgi:uncharacterized protein YjbI with pentapeptide repeats
VASQFKWSCFYAAALIEARLDDSILSYGDFRKANLQRASLRNTDLRFAILDKADLSGADLTNADITGASLTGVNLTGAKLLDLRGWKEASDLRGINFRSARAYPAGLRDVLLRHNGVDGFGETLDAWQARRDRLEYKQWADADRRCQGGSR